MNRLSTFAITMASLLTSVGQGRLGPLPKVPKSRPCSRRRLIARLGKAGVALALGVAFLSFARQCLGQGTFEPLRVTFDGSPTQPVGEQHYIPQYSESGVWFRPIGVIGPGNGFMRNGGGRLSYPENGSTYLQAGGGDSLAFSFINRSVFDLVSVDLAEYSTVVPGAAVVRFIGYRHDGSIVTWDVTTDGVIDGAGPLADFQTFHFDSRFTGLDRVEMPTSGWALDNLRISVPEPSSTSLLLAGGLWLWAWRRCRVGTPKHGDRLARRCHQPESP